MITIVDSWKELLRFLPMCWQHLAVESGALKGLRQDKDPENLLRTLLLHCGCGYSLRETILRAKEAGLATVSDVALLKRLRKCEEWLRLMCLALLGERGASGESVNRRRLRLFDATHVKEPGKTGSQWRLHYSVSLPELSCDHFSLTPAKGMGTGESFSHFAINSGDYIVADRGYCHASGLSYAVKSGAFVTVRWHSNCLPLYHGDGSSFDLLEKLESISEPGQVECWPVWIKDKGDLKLIEGRLCVVRKQEHEIGKAIEGIRQKFSKNGYRSKGYKIKESTLVFGQYVIVFSTFPPDEFSVEEILNAYRVRWQIELVFKRFKQLASFGHLPKYDERSSKAWLYGKLLAALLTEKLIAYAGSTSPWREERRPENENGYQSLAGFCFYVSPSTAYDRTASERKSDI